MNGHAIRVSSVRMVLAASSLLVALGLPGCLSDPAEPSDVSASAEALGPTPVSRLCGGPNNLQCSRTQVCSTPEGSCPGPKQFGVCRPRPEVCTDLFDPVCGCDGKTYPNACNAAVAGTSVAHHGACPQKQFCGGIAGIKCPGLGRCVDDPSDDCDPAHGGADCGGMCVCIQNVLCVLGTHFDPSLQVCSCVPDAVGPVCGTARCAAGNVCCNASCGICTPPGGVCIQIVCDPTN